MKIYELIINNNKYKLLKINRVKNKKLMISRNKASKSIEIVSCLHEKENKLEENSYI